MESIITLVFICCGVRYRDISSYDWCIILAISVYDIIYDWRNVYSEYVSIKKRVVYSRRRDTKFVYV